MPIYQYRDENGHLVATDTLPSLSSEQELQSRAAKLNGTTSRINALGHFPLTPAQREEQRKRAKQTSELRKIRDKNDEEKKLLMEKERLEQAQADLEREGYMEAVIEGGFGEKVAKSISEGNYDDAAEEIVKDYVEAKAAEKVIILAAGGWAKAWQILKGVWRASKIRKLKKALQSKIAKRLEEISEKLKGRSAHGGGTVIIKYAYNVGTKKNTAFFWSGRTQLPSGEVFGGADRAAEIAKSKGGTTLETLIKERNITIPDWDPNNPAAVKAWGDISAEYANGVSGEVRAVIGKDMRPGNIWETRELPQLMKNPKVTKITTIDPATGTETVIYP